MSDVLKIEHLLVNYEKHSVLWDISLKIPNGGKLVAIVGPNGAGKTTLVKSILGVIKSRSGKILFAGEPLKKKRKSIAYIPQRESVDWDFPITVEEVVLMGCYARLGLFRKPKASDRKRALHYLSLVGMENYSKRQISELSGGQQQRVFIARALMQEAAIYFLDEPFVGIDSTSEKVILSILTKLRSEGKTIFVINHDLDQVKESFDWAIMLNTRLVACGPIEDIFIPELLKQTFGKKDFLLEETAILAKQKAEGLC